jgi:1-phosphatidylinositol-4-phosphate 5-kinase
MEKENRTDETLTINEDIVVTEFAPDVFSFLRQKDGYSNKTLELSLDPDNNKEKVFKAGESQGKSGSFFFFSQDQKFIIKTMTDSDFNAFMRLFRSYFRHVCSPKTRSLLARVYGVYSVKMGTQKPVKLVVMGNTMLVENFNNVRGVFDLKGSMVNRYCPGETNPKATVKDRNLLEICRENIYLQFKIKDIRQINDRLREDALLLKLYNLMDYSLLLCIEENKTFQGESAVTLCENFREKKAKNKLRHQFISECGKWIYHLSVIDYLQDFNIEKKIENFLKTKKAS